MPTGNFDATPSAAPPNDSPTRRFRLPSDYYSAPLSEVRPVFPRWVPYGCGIGAAVAIIALFATGAILTGPRLAQGLDFVIGMSLGDLRGMFQGVSTEQKDAFEREVKAMRDGLNANRVPVAAVQPFLQAMQKAITDKKVTPEEVEQLTKAARDASRAR
jgi:hypothetical protein